MQGQEYLNQISASNRPVKQSKLTNILSSKLFIGGMIALVALIIIMIIGSVLGGNVWVTESLPPGTKVVASTENLIRFRKDENEKK